MLSLLGLAAMKSKYVKLKDPDGIDAMNALSDAPRGAIVLFGNLLKAMDKTNALLARHEDLADVCGVSISTLKRAIHCLEGRKYIQTRRASNGCWYSINSSIATKCSHTVENYSTGYELWSCKVLMKKSNSPAIFNKPLNLKE